MLPSTTVAFTFSNVLVMPPYCAAKLQDNVDDLGEDPSLVAAESIHASCLGEGLTERPCGQEVHRREPAEVLHADVMHVLR
mmetsp:Transcript_38512/g.108860  ORF Transcript_38512/g.108860 Transcript_38512/m.108860 type:complete len:81 (-) Transcript_38512:1689-1931(-)